jgi:hypothetical protein
MIGPKGRYMQRKRRNESKWNDPKRLGFFLFGLAAVLHGLVAIVGAFR